jgi:hypothetical protein
MPKPKKGPAKPKPDTHKEKVVSFRPPAAMRDILVELARKERRTIAQFMTLLVEDALAAKGLWPPPGEGPA